MGWATVNKLMKIKQYCIKNIYPDPKRPRLQHRVRPIDYSIDYKQIYKQRYYTQIAQFLPSLLVKPKKQRKLAKVASIYVYNLENICNFPSDSWFKPRNNAVNSAIHATSDHSSVHSTDHADTIETKPTLPCNADLTRSSTGYDDSNFSIDSQFKRVRSIGYSHGDSTIDYIPLNVIMINVDTVIPFETVQHSIFDSHEYNVLSTKLMIDKIK